MKREVRVTANDRGRVLLDDRSGAPLNEADTALVVVTAARGIALKSPAGTRRYARNDVFFIDRPTANRLVRDGLVEIARRTGV